MKVAGLKNIRVQQGHEQQFEALFSELRALVMQHETGCEFYSLSRSRSDAQHYIVEEQYRDAAAWEAHQSAPYGAVYFPKIRALLDTIDVEYFDVKVG